MIFSSPSCVGCGSEISFMRSSLARYCTRSCRMRARDRRKHRNRRARERAARESRFCPTCDAKIIGRGQKRYCSRRCWQTAHPAAPRLCLRCSEPISSPRLVCDECLLPKKTTNRLMKPVPCVICGNEFRRTHSRQSTCSTMCKQERELQLDRQDKEKHHERIHLYRTSEAVRARERERKKSSHHREYMREWRRRPSSRTKHNEDVRKWRANNLGRAREQGRRRYWADHEKTLEQHRRSYLKRRTSEAYQEKMRQYRLENLPRIREWYHANKNRLEARRVQWEAETRAALAVFNELIGPCLYKDRAKARRLLQQLGVMP